MGRKKNKYQPTEGASGGGGDAPSSSQPKEHEESEKKQAKIGAGGDTPAEMQAKKGAAGGPSEAPKQGQSQKKKGDQSQEQASNPKQSQSQKKKGDQQNPSQPRTQQQQPQPQGPSQPRTQQQPQGASQPRTQQQQQQAPSQPWGQQQQQGPSQPWGQQQQQGPSQPRGQQRQQPQGRGQAAQGQDQQQRPHRQEPGQQPQGRGQAVQGWGQQQQGLPKPRGQQQQGPSQLLGVQQGDQQGRGQQPQASQQQPQRSESRQSISSQISELSVATSSKSASKAIVSTSNISLAKGTRGRRITIESNYVDLLIKNMISTAYHYDIRFDPEKPKRLIRLAFNQFNSQLKSKVWLAFDGKANVYSPKKLLDTDLKPVEVVVAEGGSNKPMTFKVTLKETVDSKIELSSLKEGYSHLRIFDKPMRAIQCLDVVLRSACIGKGIQVGRSFYIKPSRKIDLGDCHELYLGLFQATILGKVPYLNIDICHKSFPSEVSCLDILTQSRNPPNLAYELDNRATGTLHNFLRSLNIIYKPPRSFNATDKTYKYNDLKGSAKTLLFTLDDGRKLTIDQYYREKGCNLQYPNMPCLWVGSTVRCVYLPLELCSIQAGQATLKKASDNQVRSMIKYAATTTDVRKTKILDIYRSFNHNNDSVIKQFQVQLGNDFISLNARIIDPPELEYSRKYLVTPSKGSWMPKNAHYVQAAEMHEWAILVTDRYCNDDFAVRKFGDMIRDMGRKLNMNISDKFTIKKETDSRRVNERFEEFKREKKSLVFVVISNFPDSYSKVKQGAEIQCGVLTQCLKTDTLQRRCNPSTITNILLKVNAKLNGINHIISEKSHTNIFNDCIMLLGADVTHPSPDKKNVPSVFGVAASYDKACFQYHQCWGLQDPKQEMISNMENILIEHLHFFQTKRKCLPNKIIYYRDGVSDGQFEQVRAIELIAMDRACGKVKQGYRPQITCIIVQKRHHTRFFPPHGSNIGRGDRFNNVPPGTIVDTDITHPQENQFFLLSHESIQGTAKPTKYCVIRDDARLNVDDLQAMSYNLCHMFTRCNRAVSYPAPAYYAHLIAARGRVYTEGSNINIDRLPEECRRRQVKENIISGHPMYFV